MEVTREGQGRVGRKDMSGVVVGGKSSGGRKGKEGQF
jgi:hypothetical protein